MAFTLPEYHPPDFEQESFLSSPDVRIEEVLEQGVAPAAFHATTIFPEYFKIGGKWILVEESRLSSEGWRKGKRL